MKVVLLGEQSESEFVNALKENNLVEWADTPKEVSKECNYVIILTRDILKSAEIRNKLLTMGFGNRKILEYCYFEKDPVRSRAELFQQKYYKKNYDTFLFGMSHSYCGLNEDMLRGKHIYKFSAPSMDLYYHYQLLMRLEKIYDLNKIKKLYFELPYYVFNYDVSKCPNIFRQRINFFYYLQDYHHFEESEIGRQYIYMFTKLNELTQNQFYTTFQKIELNTQENRNHFDFVKLKRNVKCLIENKEEHIWRDEEIKKIEEIEPHVWYKQHLNTVKENAEIWNSIQEWQKGHDWIELGVIVFPFCPYFLKNHRDVINVKKKEFMHNINLPNNNIIDMFDYYLDRPEYFADECHLNAKGTYEFTKILGKYCFNES